MSEELLKAIIKLLVIVAKEDGVVLESEKDSVRNFLYENVSREDTQYYLRLLDQYIKEVSTGTDDKERIKKITDSINHELTRQQKLVIMLRIIELVMADLKITPREKDLLQFLGECFRFDHQIVESIKTFVTCTDKANFDSHLSLIISGQEEDQNLPKHIFLQKLKGFIVFFHIPKIDIYFFKCIGPDILTLNGLLVSPNKIKIFSNGSSLKGKKTERLYYSEIISGYREGFVETNISFVADKIQYKFKNGKIGLHTINISEPSGKLFGIMGGSGAGKSTLFNVLSGTAKPSSGSVRINGIDIYQSPKKIEGVIGFVPQDDLLIEDLTVYQNLFYAAKLCFSKASADELEELVDTTIQSLGLTEVKGLKVGNPLQKTISGGQRKRVNIGLELLREPSVLFVDEPTSGLSSRDSENIMDLLKELSLRGKMVFVVIHQPSSDIFKMFDRLLILDVGGYEIYYGNPVEAITYFKGIVGMIDKDQAACIECGNVNPEQIFNIIESKVVDEYGRFTNKRKYNPEQWYDHFKNQLEVPALAEEQKSPEKNLAIPNKLRQVRTFLERDVLSKISNRQYVLINLLEAPALALILALITKYSPAGKEYTFYYNENIPVFFFMSIIVALFMGLTVSAEEIIKDRKILKREAFLNLSRLSYISSKTIILFSLSAIQTLLFVLVGVWVLEIQGMTLWYWIILFSVSCFANILGLNISSGFNSVITVYILIPLLIIPQLILSGVVVSFDKLNSSFSNKEKVPFIGEVMASRWAFEALAVTQFRDNPFAKDFFELDRKIGQNTYKSIYYTSFLEDELKFCRANLGIEETEEHLNLIRNELKKELKFFGEDKLPSVNRIKLETFDEEVFQEAIDFLSAIQKVYNNRRKEAKKELDDKIASLTATEALERQYIKRRETFENERLSYMLKNIATKKRLVVSDGSQVVQKIYPIYAREEHPDHFFDFRTNFYYPEKFFAGKYIDTKVFNTLVIWSMTTLLLILLYYDALKKLIGTK